MINQNAVINQNDLLIGKQSAGKVNSSKAKVIKRYQNRKLYDTQQSCYVTLDDIAKMIRTNEEVVVIDNKSKCDITAATLTQIIFEAEKKASQYAPLFTLREIIQNGNGSISNFLAKLGAFPEDYVATIPQGNGLVPGENFVEDTKVTTDTRVANAVRRGESRSGRSAERSLHSGQGAGPSEDETPHLPTSNISLNMGKF